MLSDQTLFQTFDIKDYLNRLTIQSENTNQQNFSVKVYNFIQANNGSGAMKVI